MRLWEIKLSAWIEGKSRSVTRKGFSIVKKLSRIKEFLNVVAGKRVSVRPFLRLCKMDCTIHSEVSIDDRSLNQCHDPEPHPFWEKI